MLDKLKNICKTPSLRYRSFTTVSEVPSVDWNIVNKGQLFLSLPYLQALESALATSIDFKYLLFYRETMPVAIAVTQLLRFNTSELSLYELPCAIGETLRNSVIQNLDVSALVCGNLFTCGEHGFAYTDQITAREAYELLGKTMKELRRSDAKDKPSFLVLKEFWPQSVVASDVLLDQKFRTVHIDVNMVLSLQTSWSSFEEYLLSMKTKFRTRAKKVLATSADLEVKEFTEEMITHYEQEINELYLSVIENADFKIAQLSAEAFRLIKEALGALFVFKGYFLDNKLVGFSTAFIVANAVEANHIGIDYAYNISHAIYQRMLYDYVDLAINKRVKYLRLGRTAELIKSSIGAQAVPMRLYVRHGNSVSNKLLKPVVGFIQPNDYEIRTPFKT